MQSNPVRVSFFRLDSGREPVREWLKSLRKEQRKAIGEDIKTLQFGWPVGMPLVRKLADDLCELRSDIPNGIARTFVTILDDQIVLLHGFVKKTMKIPPKELAVAKRRLARLRS
ncbi:MAG: type II toxin-antitoxin system RelE/ParE family toxin [Gammaproteobacteria bacterium]|nr:MAG: type II toxin-antitoxin system RelE/ParE family toxin [Gammaproteobacteria bacterium]